MAPDINLAEIYLQPPIELNFDGVASMAASTLIPGGRNRSPRLGRGRR